ncbi:MAG: hypothetical protein QM731_06345 [Chitinophagaceae bacterium]
MKKFFHHLNNSVGLLAGICTIILFFRELFFQKNVPVTKQDSTITYREDNKNPQIKTDTNSYTYNTTINQNPVATEKRPLPKSITDTLPHPKTASNYISSEKSATFFITFIKTPVVFYALLLALLGCFFVGAYQLFQNLFTKFEHGFETTQNIWNWGWDNITIDWWWDNGVGWHLAISIAVWSIIFYLINNSE